MAPLSFWDRIVYGAITMFVGLLVGLGLAFAVAYALDKQFQWSIVAFSAVFFFFVGFIRGADAGFFAGDAFSFTAALGAAEAGVAPGDPSNKGQPKAWSSAWLFGTYLLIVAILGWLA